MNVLSLVCPFYLGTRKGRELLEKSHTVKDKVVQVGVW